MKNNFIRVLVQWASAILAVSSLWAQTTWMKTYGGAYDDVCYSVRQTTDGGYVGTGITYTNGNYGQVYLFRTDSLGVLLWSRSYGGYRDDAGQSVLQTADGGFLVAGWTKSYGPGTPACANVYLLRTNPNGDTLWTRVYGGSGEDCGYAARADADGGYIIAGSTASVGAGGSDVYLVKTDASGDTLWTKAIGGPADELAHSVECAPGGGYLLGGNTFSFGPGVPDSSNAYLIRTDGAGDTLWTRVFGSARNDGFQCARPVPSGGFVAVGWSAQGSSNETFIVRTDGTGDTLWTRHIGGAGLDDGLEVEPTDDGGFIIAGFSDSYGAGGVDVYLVKTDSLGAVQWYRTFGGPQWDFAESIQLTSDGGYIIGGYTYSFGPGTPTNCNAYLVKTDWNGYTGVAGPPSPAGSVPGSGRLRLRGWPNPFQRRINIQFESGVLAKGPLKVYDATGRFVKKLSCNSRGEALCATSWDGTDASGRAVPGGLYFIRLAGETASRTTRVALIR